MNKIREYEIMKLKKTDIIAHPGLSVFGLSTEITGAILMLTVFVSDPLSNNLGLVFIVGLVMVLSGLIIILAGSRIVGNNEEYVSKGTILLKKK